MQQTALQLPAGAVLVLDVRGQQHNMQQPHSMQQPHVPSNTNHDLASSLQTCRDLCRHHRLNYIFDSGVSIPFEADYRTIVLSNHTTCKLLPCTMTVQWSHCCNDDDNNNNKYIGTLSSFLSDVAGDGGMSSPALLPALREYLQQCRCGQQYPNNNSNIGLDKAVLVVAQNDFLAVAACLVNTREKPTFTDG